MQPIIEITNISKVYHIGTETIYALQKVDLNIFKNEYVALMGPSGSGKSTLLNILGCLDAPTTGVVRVDGQDLARLGPRERARYRAERVGFVFQQYHLVPYLTAVENVMLAQYFHSLAD